MEASVAHDQRSIPTPLKIISPLLPERDAAYVLGLSTAWLQRERWAGTGPAYVRHRRAVRYRLEDLQAWIASHRVGGECA
jgi:predicted DNA-binding transcriptional regulator AlpA